MLATAILRLRLVMPSQCCEQRLQRPHWPSLQSRSPWHWTWALQLAYIFEGPKAGLPQALASAKARRERQVRPPAQVLEQGSHSSQSPHWPSTQVSSGQRNVLQGSVSSLDMTAQGLPPRSGAVMTWRSRPLCPPSQRLLQLLQSDQRPHMQSTVGQGRRLSHSRVSLRGKRHPSPPSCGRCSTRRSLTCWPVPHVAAHELHEFQSLTMQSLL